VSLPCSLSLYTFYQSSSGCAASSSIHGNTFSTAHSTPRGSSTAISIPCITDFMCPLHSAPSTTIPSRDCCWIPSALSLPKRYRECLSVRRRCCSPSAVQRPSTITADTGSGGIHVSSCSTTMSTTTTSIIRVTESRRISASRSCESIIYVHRKCADTLDLASTNWDDLLGTKMTREQASNRFNKSAQNGQRAKTIPVLKVTKAD
jgi:hypothetical protein